MQINYSKEAEKITIAPAGRLDTTTAPEFEKTVVDLLGDVSALVLDMTNVEYVSSAGLRVILKAQKMMSARGKMKVIGVNDMIMEVFEITGFTDILTIE